MLSSEPPLVPLERVTEGTGNRTGIIIYETNVACPLRLLGWRLRCPRRVILGFRATQPHNTSVLESLENSFLQMFLQNGVVTWAMLR